MCYVPAQENQPLDVYLLGTSKTHNPIYLRQREIFGIKPCVSLTQVPGQEPFSMGFIKGCTRTTAAQFIVWCQSHLGISLQKEWPLLHASLQVIHVILHQDCGPEGMLIKSMGALLDQAMCGMAPVPLLVSLGKH
jgi:hypothetical protein